MVRGLANILAIHLLDVGAGERPAVCAGGLLDGDAARVPSGRLFHSGGCERTDVFGVAGGDRGVRSTGFPAADRLTQRYSGRVGRQRARGDPGDAGGVALQGAAGVPGGPSGRPGARSAEALCPWVLRVQPLPLRF